MRVNRNRHTVPCTPNRYRKRGACAGLSYSLTPSTSRSISNWWARRVPVACLGHVLRGGTGWAGGRRERRKRASHPVNRAYTHNILQFSYFLLGNEPIRGSQFSSFLHVLPCNSINEKSENTNCSTLNACGLAIFFKFLPSLVLQ